MTDKLFPWVILAWAALVALQAFFPWRTPKVIRYISQGSAFLGGAMIGWLMVPWPGNIGAALIGGAIVYFVVAVGHWLQSRSYRNWPN